MEEKKKDTETTVNNEEGGTNEPAPNKADKGPDGSGAGDERGVPYSRFAKYVREAREGERENEELRRRLEEYERGNDRRAERDFGYSESPDEVPQWFQDIYGSPTDPEMGPKVKRAWEVEVNRIVNLEKRAEEAADRRFERRMTEEQMTYERNLKTLEDSQSAFEEYIGRPLTKKEEDGVMEILDEYSPQDERGIDYLLPFDKAFEIYEMRSRKSKETQKKIAGFSSASSSGETADLSGGNPYFNQRDFGNWRKDPRLPTL